LAHDRDEAGRKSVTRLSHQTRLRSRYRRRRPARAGRSIVARGIAKDKARIDQWLKDVAPSDTLRRRFHGNPAMWNEFVTAYGHELAQDPAAAAAAKLHALVRKQPVTLLYAARDRAHNNAVALKKWLERKSRARPRSLKAPDKT
jgi:uncharacterized protein YeaO (DUF488 family)